MAPPERTLTAGSPLDASGKRSFSSNDAKLLDNRIERLEGLVRELLASQGKGGKKGPAESSTPTKDRTKPPRASVAARANGGKGATVLAVAKAVAEERSTPTRSRLSRPDSVDCPPSFEDGQQIYDVTKLDGDLEGLVDSEEDVINESGAWMIDPTKAFRITWDIGVLMPFLIYLLFSMPFRLCFQNDPVCYTGIYWFELTIEVAFIVDIGFSKCPVAERRRALHSHSTKTPSLLFFFVVITYSSSRNPRLPDRLCG